MARQGQPATAQSHPWMDLILALYDYAAQVSQKLETIFVSGPMVVLYIQHHPDAESATALVCKVLTGMYL